MTEAPERIVTSKCGKTLVHDGMKRFETDVEYIRKDVAEAMVAAAYDAAARAAFRAGKSVHSGYRDENERIAQRIENELRLEVQAAIRGARKQGPQETLAALLKAEREKALLGVMSMITMRIVQAAGGGENLLSPSDIYKGVEALISEDKTDG